MSLNAADLLLQFFKADSIEKDQYSVTALWAAVAEVEGHLELWEARGTNAEPFRLAIVGWKREILSHMDPNTAAINAQDNLVTISSGDVGVLAWAATLLRESTPATTAEQRESVRSLVQEARGLLARDESLPERLRLHIVQLMLHVEEVLDRFEITGDSALEDAVERLLGALRFAEQASKEPTAWSQFWEKWATPIAVGMLSGSPGTVLSITQMLGA